MYKVIGIDIKNNRYNVLDTVYNTESICTREQLMQSRKMGFKVFGVLPDGQVVVWDTFYNLSLLSDSGKKKLMEILKYYNIMFVTDDGTINKDWTGNCMVLNFSGLTDMSCLFFGYSEINLDLSNFDTSNVTNMQEMFLYCNAKKLNLSSFDTSKVTNMSSMFRDCRATRIDLSSFDTSKVTDMNSMFWMCEAKSLDLRNFDTSSVTDMRYMFRECKAESLDLSSFNISDVTDMKEMFNDYLGKEIILREHQKSLIKQAKKDGQGSKIRYV